MSEARGGGRDGGGTDHEEHAQVEEAHVAVRDCLVEASAWPDPMKEDPAPTAPVGRAQGCRLSRVLEAPKEPGEEIPEALGLKPQAPVGGVRGSGFGGTCSMVEPETAPALADAKPEAIRASEASALVSPRFRRRRHERLPNSGQATQRQAIHDVEALFTQFAAAAEAHGVPLARAAGAYKATG